LPGYAGIDTLDYFLRHDEWLRINLEWAIDAVVRATKG
jgi:hypothetical protein